MEYTRKIVIAIWFLLGIFLLTLLDWQFGGLKFVGRRANGAVGLISSCLPLVCVLFLYRLPPCRARTWALTGFVPAALFCILGGAFFGFGQCLLMYTRHACVHVGPSEIVTYFEDAGAWDDGEVMVQQEITLLPGLLWIKPISKAECLREVKITVLDRHHIQYEYAADTVDSYDPSPAAKRNVAWVF